MRLISRLVIILLICFIAATPLAMPAEAQDDEEPTITLSRSSGVPGITEITVYGTNFTPDEYVDIFYDGTREETTMTGPDGAFQVDLDIPESCKGYHTVLAQDDEDEDDTAYFEAEPGLAISPLEGRVDATVTVEGHGFDCEEDDIQLLYYLNSTSYKAVAGDIKAYDDGSWETTFAIPPSNKGYHKIDALSFDSELTDVHDTNFEVIPSISLAESSGSAGESIAITGTGFEADDRYIKIIFATVEAKTEPDPVRADENGSWTATFEVPEMSRGTYAVTAEGVLTSREDISSLDFNIAPGLVLSHYEGHVGMNLTVMGGGFDPDEDVVIKYDTNDLEPPATAKTNDDGSFEVSFLVPKSKYGAHNVTAEFDSETEAAANFTMESDAPDVPGLVSPPDGDRLGFIGNVRVTLNWSEVEDLSGVYYSLRIWTANNVTKVSKVGLVGSNYTLNDIEALPQGTYYWSVQAVDGAENESGWTEPRSFRVGVMPLWAFVIIIVVAAGGIGALIYFRVIRQRVYYY